MKVYISYNLKNTSSGGGRNFLNLLRDYLLESSNYSYFAKKSDVILINSHHNLYKNIFLKFIYPKKIFVHRLDGKLSLHRSNPDWDNLIIVQNRYVADYNIFQSNWSREIWSKQLDKKKSRTILNSPNRKIFKEKQEFGLNNPVRVVFSAWSSNPNKGYNFAKWAISKANKFNIEVRILGYSKNEKLNSVAMRRIDQIELNMELNSSDIFLSPTINEACSNSILEAFAVGLPVLANNSGGNPELISGGKGEVFNSKQDFEDKLSKIVSNYGRYVKEIRDFNQHENNLQIYKEYFMSIYKDNSRKNVYLIRLGLIKAFTEATITFLRLQFK